MGILMAVPGHFDKQVTEGREPVWSRGEITFRPRMADATAGVRYGGNTHNTAEMFKAKGD